MKSHAPTVGYRESIRKPVTQKGRHKKQSGGHGQFGDVIIEVKPLPRGSGFQFEEKITAARFPSNGFRRSRRACAKRWSKGPLGFQVVDCAVSLVDGSYHSVDSSELAFRLAGRIAMQEALAAAQPHLLEPMHKLTVVCPSSATSRITSAVAGRRGQMLGMAPRDGWTGWDRIEALIPEAELRGLEAELRSQSQGLATYEAEFDHLAELNGPLADKVSSNACPSPPDRVIASVRGNPTLDRFVACARLVSLSRADEALVQGPAFPFAAEEQQLSRRFARRRGDRALATCRFAAHGLGVLLFGALILITSYAKAVSGIAKFQSWQLIVRYGGRALHGELEDFKTSTGFAFALDAVSGDRRNARRHRAPAVHRRLGRHQARPAVARDALLHAAADHGRGHADGVLRALDRFDLISWAGHRRRRSAASILVADRLLRWRAVRGLCRASGT